MKPAEKVIISCAVTGSVHTPTMSEFLPLSPADIVKQSMDAVGAGAAVLHLHARVPDTGQPTGDPDVFRQFIEPLQRDSRAVLNISTGGSTQMSIDDRLAASVEFEPELASLNMGSMNFVYASAVDRYDDWRFEWERPYLSRSYEAPFMNTFAQIEHTLRLLGGPGRTRFEFECYDIGHLYSLAHFAEKRSVEPPFFIQGVFGILGGIGADHANLDHMVRIADQLFGDDYSFSAFGVGRHQASFVAHTALLGGHVRVGLEDSLYIRSGELARDNASLVRRAVDLLDGLGLEIADPDDARRILQLKGAGHHAAPGLG